MVQGSGVEYGTVRMVNHSVGWSCVVVYVQRMLQKPATAENYILFREMMVLRMVCHDVKTVWLRVAGNLLYDSSLSLLWAPETEYNDTRYHYQCGHE